MTKNLFTQTDLEQMEKLGITEEEARRQLAILEKGQRWAALVRPCTPGDGIAILDPEDQERLISRWQEGADKGRLSAFLPASGAATRMFAFVITSYSIQYTKLYESFTASLVLGR